jgi:hypothetical protein
MKKIGWIIAAAFMFGNSSVASSASFRFSGNLTNHNDVIKIGFSVANDTTNVKVWTDSFGATGLTQEGPGTNFDPITALWNADTGVLLAENDDDPTIAPGQTYFDSGFSLATLSAGNYLFTMATFDNFALGTNITDGFAYDSQSPILISDWDQPSNEGNLRGTFWRINLEGVDTVTPPPTSVPLPSAIWMFGSAILSLVGFCKKKIY